MKKILASLAIAGLFSGLFAASGLAQTPPQVQSINNGDLFQDLPNGYVGPGNTYASALQLSGYFGSLPSRGNLLIGGDASTNLWQRGTGGSAVTTTATYGGADRWFIWSGASTQIKLIEDTTDTAPAGYVYGFKLQRTASQTGVAQACMAQEIEGANSTQLQGQTVEVDFHAMAGATFSAASGDITAYLIYGTDSGGNGGSVNLAYGLNAGGGGSNGWTGQANAAAGVIPLQSTPSRYAVLGSIPATATEVALALCYTPVGTAGANDYPAFWGIQLTRNPSLAGYASATAAYQCNANTGGGNPSVTLTQIPCSSFERRLQGIESVYQYRYAYAVNEGGAASHPALQFVGGSNSATTCSFNVPFPAVMRAVPTYTQALTATTFKFLPMGGTAVVLSTPFSALFDTTTGNNAYSASITVTASTVTQTAGYACALEGIGGGGQMLFSAEL